jgi:hypothetical protein
LGKIGNHLSAGNWASVLVELLVVVVGVYGAFQLENWGEELRESQREYMLLEQLHNEIQYAFPLMEEQFENRKLTANAATQVAEILMQPVGAGELTTEQCAEIFEVSVLKWNSLSLTTLDEMVGSGVLSQLQNRELSTLLFSLQADMNFLAAYMQLVRSQQIILMDVYPDLVPRGIDAKGEAFQQCNTDGMRASQAFINHLMSNRGRYMGMAGRLEQELNSLSQIHIKLDEVLQTSGSNAITLHENQSDN